MSEYFTAVFQIDITKFDGNPMTTETPFGKPVACGIGDAFDRLNAIDEIEEAALNLVQAINRHREIEELK